VNKDGYITAEEMQVGLSHLRVKCPYSQCVYQCKKDVVHDFVARVAGERQSAFQYNDFRHFFLLMPSNDMMIDYYMSARDSSPCDIGSCVVLHKRTGGNPMGHLLAGAMSGAVSRTVTAPLETLRMMAMTGNMPEGGTIKAAQSVVRANGWKGLFRGNGVNVMRSAPQKALDFFIFDGMKVRVRGTVMRVREATSAYAPPYQYYITASNSATISSCIAIRNNIVIAIII
jgi:solute carrier family 25 phosphate transporter 23/24/25/41